VSLELITGVGVPEISRDKLTRHSRRIEDRRRVLNDGGILEPNPKVARECWNAEDDDGIDDENRVTGGETNKIKPIRLTLTKPYPSFFFTRARDN